MKVMGIMMAGLLMAACGGDDDPPPTADRPDIINGPDASTEPQVDAAVVPVTCNADESYGDVTIDQVAAEVNLAGDGSVGSIEGVAVLNQDMDVMDLQLYAGFTVFAGGIEPGTFELTGDELNYATCGVCLFVFTEADDAYFATGGTVTITEAGDGAGGGNLAFTVANATFEHVNINMSTFESTPHPDMCESALTSATFPSTALAMP